MAIGLTQSTSLGLGWRMPETKLKLRAPSNMVNLANAGFIERGSIVPLDILLEGDETLGLYGDPAGEQYTKSDPYANVWDTRTSAARAVYPCVVAAEDVTLGRTGTFFLTHPDIQVLNAPGASCIRGDALVLDNAGATETARPLRSNADLVPNSWARFVGWANETSTGPGALFYATFDGLHQGLAGGIGIA